MADDDVELPGTGELIAVDLITGGPADGKKVQRVKAGFGTDGVYSDVELISPLPIEVISGGTAVGVAAPLPTQLYVGAGGTAVDEDHPLSVAITSPAELAVEGAEVTMTNPLPVLIESVAGPYEYANPLHVTVVNPNLTVNGSYVDEGHPVPVSGTVGVSGTVPTSAAYTELSGSASANSTDLVASTDVRGYGWISLHITGTFTATVMLQGSNNNSDWSNLVVTPVTSATAMMPQTGMTAAGVYVTAVSTRYIRVRTTAYTSGTATATVELSAVPGSLPALSAASASLSSSSTSAVQFGLLSLAAQLLYAGGNSYTRLGNASAAEGGDGTTAAGAGILGWDGSAQRRIKTDASGITQAATVPTGAAASAVTSVAASASSVSLLASNSSRKAATFYNDSASAYLSIKLGATASATSFTVKLGPGGYYELPTAVTYRGAIDGIWDAAVGSARITELT